MKKCLLLTLLAAVFVSCGQTYLPPPAGYALVYGISNYSILRDLSYTDDDAGAVAELLQRKGYDVTLRDADGTKDQLIADIARISQVIGPYDTFIFYYAGHGGRHYDRYFPVYSDPPGTEPAYQDSDDEWIFLSGSLTEDSFGAWPETAVSDDELRDILAVLPTLKKLVIMDACNSGGFINNDLIKDGIPQDYGLYRREDRIFANTVSLFFAPPQPEGPDVPAESAIVFAAAGEREYSFENASINHGIFTYFLLQTPSRGDAGGDGYISLMEAYAYVSGRLEEEWNNFVSEDLRYYPHVSGIPFDIILFPAD